MTTDSRDESINPAASTTVTIGATPQQHLSSSKAKSSNALKHRHATSRPLMLPHPSTVTSAGRLPCGEPIRPATMLLAAAVMACIARARTAPESKASQAQSQFKGKIAGGQNSSVLSYQPPASSRQLDDRR